MSETNSENSQARTSGAIPEPIRAALHAKEEICRKLADLSVRQDVTDYAGEIAALCSAFSACDEVPPEYAELLEKKFSEALEAAKAGEAVFAKRCEQAAKLSGDVDALLNAGEFATLKEIEALEKKIAELAPGSDLISKLAPLKAMLEADAAATAAAEAAALKLAEELNTLIEAGNVEALKTRKDEIEKEFAQLAGIPRPAAQRYNDAHRKASVLLAQHYETLDLARWESYTLKLDICTELEKLNAAADSELGKISKTLTDIRDRWKKLGSVPKEKNDEINPRYMELTRNLQHRVDEYFARKRQEQKIASAEKIKLCEECEALADSTDWAATAARLKELQSQWKTLPRAGAAENDLFQRFHAAADKFFTARKVVLDERDKKFRDIEARKRELIAEAGNLTDVRRAKELREEFRSCGSAGRKENELYREFNAAMDAFFNGRRQENASREQRARELIAEVNNCCDDALANRGRVKEISDELRNLNCRDTRNDEQSAMRKFDTALNAALESERAKKLEISVDITRDLANVYDAFKRGENPEAPAPENYTAFAKLHNAAVLLGAAINGDSKAADKLEKQIAAARSERIRICEALEKLAGIGTDAEAPKTLSLAEELAAAMMGNFGKNENDSRRSDPKRLLADFAAAGIVPAAELTACQERVDKAKAVIFHANGTV